ncbi:MAG: GTP-binding protein [Bdellovibrionota bacterium]
MRRSDIRNICIIAHVDHGKTTLVDHLLKSSQNFNSHKGIEERAMDSHALERERGITILAKNCSTTIDGIRVNIVDTPGHADFGGEVERILGTVEGAILLVDAAEGPLPQTRFVLSKALEQGHRIILCINKVDRPEVRGTPRIQEVVDATFDLFVELGATEEQCDFPIIYACARDGWCVDNYDSIEEVLSGNKTADLSPLLSQILEFLPGPLLQENDDLFKMQLSNLAWSEYVGQLAIGKVVSGAVCKNDQLYRLGLDSTGNAINSRFQVTRVYRYDGMKQVSGNLRQVRLGSLLVVKMSRSAIRLLIMQMLCLLHEYRSTCRQFV